MTDISHLKHNGRTDLFHMKKIKSIIQKHPDLRLNILLEYHCHIVCMFQ